ncbi:hypothetical protein KYK30_00295 [Shinella yambaruensis]|uniref:hypothetical protein n=1 Tax=Shinella TaxID=323620 RepID=UPI001FD2C272|nr:MULTISPECIES: hypothetical protein [Shinella]MCJ8026158.1 hypothetical protein [Shinella yambaruensis]MCU7978120.1 hypothetical protein [Shinella yambaruensis]MCW5706579.1 hypothetical protein [Shinella sp.]
MLGFLETFEALWMSFLFVPRIRPKAFWHLTSANHLGKADLAFLRRKTTLHCVKRSDFVGKPRRVLDEARGEMG